MVFAEAARAFLEAAAIALEVAAAVVILAGAALALARGARALAAGDRLGPVRRSFGGTLLLALDFTIGADLLKVATAPSLAAVAAAGAVVAVRIGLTLILLYEVGREKREEREENSRRPT